jgi:5'-3' exonuclease
MLVGLLATRWYLRIFFKARMSSILIDTSNLLYRGYYSFPNHPCGEVFFTLTTIRSYLTNSSSHVYLCLDGTPKGKQINEAYKANRDHGEVSVYRYLPQLVYMLQNLHRVHIAYNPDLEADEVIFSLTRILDGNKLIVSTDNDLLQSLKEDTEIQRQDKIINEQYYRTEMVQKFHSVTPSRLPVYRAIVGDSSDNLKPPVPRFPKELAALIAESIDYDGTVPTKERLQALFLSFDNLTKSKKEKLNLLLENYHSFSTNFEIMKLNVHTDLNYPFLKENPIIPNFPSGVMGVFKTIKLLDANQEC